MGQTSIVEQIIEECTSFDSEPSTDWVQDIHNMHTKFGVRPVIRKLSKEHKELFLKFRLDFLKEELLEAYEAAGYTVTFNAVREGDLDPRRAEDVVDAMVDLCVVAIGTMDAFDVDAQEAWGRVHAKNMAKEPGVKPERPNPLGLPDLIKPNGWTPPTHADNIGTLNEVFSKVD